ncbi:MAG TPA: hypothetical protein VFF27_16430, partial [Bacteroidia bacterium]|nr:hypothetical protein [Bacteroidia bacterium]
MSLLKHISYPTGAWKYNERMTFRFFIIFFVLMLIPFNWTFYQSMLAVHWSQMSVQELFLLIHDFAPTSSTGYAYWIWAFILGILGSGIWDYLERDVYNYEVLNYLFCITIRYSLAFGISIYGWANLFPFQEIPTASDLFIGSIELLAAVFLFFRITTLLGAISILASFIFSWITYTFYETAERNFSLLAFLIVTYLCVYNNPGLYSILRKRKQVTAFKYIFRNKSFQSIRLVLKLGFISSIVLLGLKAYAIHKNRTISNDTTVDEGYYTTHSAFSDEPLSNDQYEYISQNNK